MTAAATRKLPMVGEAEPPPGDGVAAGELLQVGDLARAAGKTVRAIHHYEEVGLLRPSARSKGRFRLYDASAVTRVRWIGKLHDVGMSLGEIQQVLASWEASPSAPGAMAAIRDVYAEKLEATRAQIARLRDLERELEASLTYLDTCDRCDPAELIRACSACQVRDAADHAPELVAGLSLAPAAISPSPGGCSCGPPMSRAERTVPASPTDPATTAE